MPQRITPTVAGRRKLRPTAVAWGRLACRQAAWTSGLITIAGSVVWSAVLAVSTSGTRLLLEKVSLRGRPQAESSSAVNHTFAAVGQVQALCLPG